MSEGPIKMTRSHLLGNDGSFVTITAAELEDLRRFVKRSKTREPTLASRALPQSFLGKSASNLEARMFTMLNVVEPQFVPYC